MNLLSIGVYTIGIIRIDRVRLSMDLKDTKSFKNFEQGFMQ